MNLPYDAALMVGFGGPTRPDEIRPFLQNVARGRSIPPARLEDVVHHYLAIGGRSPYNELVLRQAGALRALLEREGDPIPVHAGMRNWTPYVKDVMREIAAGGARRIFCFPLAPHRSEASWDRYRQTVDEALAGLGSDAPAIGYPEPWHAHPLFIGAGSARFNDAMAGLSAAHRARAQVIFTAHSIPAAMDAHSGYGAQIAESCRLAARQLGLERWTLAYQSRSGNPRDPWLEPDVGQVLRGLSGQAAVVMPIGFICDHVEMLYDLDLEAASVARASDVTMRRAATVGDHPLFIRMIAELLRCGSIAIRNG
ncbi:MAG TPA: ferrochelatase [Candidatus Binataceae bacterium]